MTGQVELNSVAAGTGIITTAAGSAVGTAGMSGDGGPASSALLNDACDERKFDVHGEPVLLGGCGYWTQQERSAEVSQALIGFARDLD